MIGNSSDESVKGEGIVIEEMVIGMITETDQAKGVEVILAEETEEDEDVLSDIWAAGKPETKYEDENICC